MALAVPSFSHAQTSGQPVAPYSYGRAVGVPSNPFYAVLSSVAPSASATGTIAANPVELYTYGHRAGTSSNPLTVYISGGLEDYLKSADAASTYIPLSQKGIASGVASLDSNGNITAPINNTGNSTFGGDISVSNGKAITFHGPSGSTATSPYIYSNASGVLTLIGPFTASSISASSSAYVPDTAITDNTTAALNTETAASRFAQLAIQNVFNSEQHFAYAYFADPDQGVQRDAKFGDKGIAVSGGTKTDTLNVTGAATIGGTITATTLTGTGTAYACISATGVITRSATACVASTASTDTTGDTSGK